MPSKLIIPAVLSADISTVVSQFKQFDSVAQFIQLDVADGQFVNSVTCRPSAVKSVLNLAKLEIHLMVANPSAWLDECSEAGASRVYLHVETNLSINTIQAFKDKGMEVFLSLNPETPIEVFLPYESQVAGCLFLGVNPGKQGQEFITSTLDKIISFKEDFPEKTIVVDGGVNLTNIKQLSVAGVDWFVCGSAIFSSAVPIEEYRLLNELL